MINDKAFKNNKAFTLQELLIVIAIIAILIAVTIQIFSASLEKGRRAVDMSNARNIVAALSVGYLSGDIVFPANEFHGNPTNVCVVVGKEGMKCFASGSTEILGNSYDNSGGIYKHDRVSDYLASNGIYNITVKADKATDSSGWKFYVVFLYSDGTVRIGSGADDSYNDYSDSTFESHANWWKSAVSSNIETAMGL